MAIGAEYNERADVFSYGLVLSCGLIARAPDADADKFRSADYALDETRFRRAYVSLYLRATIVRVVVNLLLQRASFTQSTKVNPRLGALYCV